VSEQRSSVNLEFVRRSALLASLFFCGTAFGQAPAAPLALEGHADQGMNLATTCNGCHGVPGSRNAYPSFRVPKLGGQNADYLEVALQNYQRGNRSHPTMGAQAAVLSDQDIADIAAYLTTREGTPGTGISEATQQQIDAGAAQATVCAACHGEKGIAAAPQWPNLAGQHASYLERALTQYQTGDRKDPVMGPLVKVLNVEDLLALAAYYAAQPGLYTTVP
jgi:cytochrome c553